MSVVKEQYQELTPTAKNLVDVVVLAQAWKKSHAFIRRHNWYADVLELDASTVGLEEQLTIWGKAVGQDGFQLNDLCLVPAPKNFRWEFKPLKLPESVADFEDIDIDDFGAEPSFSDWAPQTKSGQDGQEASYQKLRPLAHLSIRDQTLATAVMMCLAEAVESAQGDTSVQDIMLMRERGVVSYGNRLLCNWVERPNARSLAKFSWGNGRTYRQYFQDYRTFLARPRRICSEFSTQLPPRRELYVVSLDIKSFFDRVDVPALVLELRRIEADHRQRYGLPAQSAADEDFWKCTERIFSWRWREKDHEQSELIVGEGREHLELGLPQGLVASGFLANAYLLKLDEALNKAAQERSAIDDGIKLLDYCRYVDDMRIVVEASAGQRQDAIQKHVETYVSKLLEAHRLLLGAQKMLELSPGKSSITPYRSISAQSNVSALMDVLNAELSGTFDLESLAQAAGGLDGLLWMSEQIDVEMEVKPSRLRLATVAVPNTDVRDDTVKRFVATRMAQLMRHRLAMTDATGSEHAGDSLSDRVTNGMALAHEFESTARKLIKCWAENPSLALLLRCGLDLFPHPKLLAPVSEALCVKLFTGKRRLQHEQILQVRVAEYVLADLFRAGAVEIGFREAQEYPESVDIQGFREELGVVARRVLSERLESPWYLQQQALLFLASIGDTSLMSTLKVVDSLVSPYVVLGQAMAFASVPPAELKSVLPLALVAQQLYPNPRRFGVWLAEGLRRMKDVEVQASVVMTVALQNPDLMMAALNSTRGKAQSWREYVPLALLETTRGAASRRNSGARRSTRSLLHVMQDTENVFGQENGVLLLAKALLTVTGIEARLSSGLSAVDVTLTCSDWSRVHELPKEEGFLRVQLSEPSEKVSPLYENPQWVADEKSWLYGLGRILRAALTGEFDFTCRRYLVTEEIGQYTGLRSSWFKRRFGMLNSGTGLLDEPGPVSPWLSGFLSTLLQWPGVEFRANHAAEVGNVRTSEELLALIETRIAEQRALFGFRSKTPMYVVPTDDHAELQNRKLRVAIVQPLLPRRAEFDAKDPTHWTPGALAKHRRHLAEVCRLAYQKLRTWASAQPPREVGDEYNGPVVDLVLFPELSVHPEHVFLLRRLSDKLGANIFAGLTFLHSPALGGPINQGLWLIRTESPGRGRSIQYAWQGKRHPMKLEKTMGVKGHRPHITLVELPVGSKTRTRVAAAICYDATDLDLVADLRDKSDVFLVAALNQDVQTFDNMVAALHFHMYQPVVLANSGEFGGSTAQTPLPKHDRLIAHVHGGNQVAVSVFEVDPTPFKSTTAPKVPPELKGPPAGYKGRPC